MHTNLLNEINWAKFVSPDKKVIGSNKSLRSSCFFMRLGPLCHLIQIGVGVLPIPLNNNNVNPNSKIEHRIDHLTGAHIKHKIVLIF